MTLSDVVLPDDYSALLADLKTKIASARQVAVRTVNTQLITLYWTIGQSILRRQVEQGWGAKVIDRLATDLRAEFPDMTGLSRRNLHYMAALAHAWPEAEVVQQAAAQLPWGHLMVVLDKLEDQPTRDWYVARAVEHSWSRNMLLNQIKAKTGLRVGAAPSNFAATLPADAATQSQALTKDPYALEFLGLTHTASERQLEDALVSRLQQTLQEFGPHLAFVGRQHHLEVGGQDYFIDLLFFDVVHLRYVVFELKIGAFEPEFAGKLAFYINAVDDLVRRQDKHEPTIGILLCADANRTVVQYALHGTTSPMAVSRYDLLPPEEQQALPSAAALTEAVTRPVTVDGRQMTLAEGIELLRLDGQDTEPR